jgi:uncharacterized membrane protein YeiH
VTGNRRNCSGVLAVLEMAGLYVLATSGALLGSDLVGIVILARLTALGGGILRDLIGGYTPPATFTRIAYLPIPLPLFSGTYTHPLGR